MEMDVFPFGGESTSGTDDDMGRRKKKSKKKRKSTKHKAKRTHRHKRKHKDRRKSKRQTKRDRREYESNMQDTRGKKIPSDQNPHCGKKTKREEEKEEKSKGIMAGDTREVQGMTLICAEGNKELWTKALFHCPIRCVINPKTKMQFGCSPVVYSAVARHIWAHQASRDAPQIMDTLVVKNCGVRCLIPECAAKNLIFYEKRTWIKHRKDCPDARAGKIPRQKKLPGWHNCDVPQPKKKKQRKKK